MTVSPSLATPLRRDVAEACRREFGEPQVLARAPGRVNLLGEHTDYNGGFVFPAAIDREVVVAVRERSDGRAVLRALNFDQGDAFDLAAPAADASTPSWSRYVRGVVRSLAEAGHRLGGFEATVAGDVPDGAGLSSSAAFEVAFVRALDALFGLGLPGAEVALRAQRAEHLVGVNCGIMDQFASALGQPDAAILLDCRSLAHRAIPLHLAERDAAIVILDSKVRRELVDSAFNRRRAECAEATSRLAELLGRPDVRALRDVSADEFHQVADRLPEVLRARARHVVTEDDRLLGGVRALEAGDLVAFGEAMDGSHASLRDDYAVSHPALDALVELTRAVPGVLGSRMTGAGFGGCTVTLAARSAVEAIRAQVLPAYAERVGREAAMFVCEASAGASVL